MTLTFDSEAATLLFYQLAKEFVRGVESSEELSKSFTARIGYTLEPQLKAPVSAAVPAGSTANMQPSLTAVPQSAADPQPVQPAAVPMPQPVTAPQPAAPAPVQQWGVQVPAAGQGYIPQAVPNAAVPIVPNTAPAGQIPVATAAYTQNDLVRACGSLVRSGRREELSVLLKTSFGVESLASLPESQYGAFATALRGMGAEI